MKNLDKISKSLLRDVARNMGHKDGKPIEPYLAEIANMEPIEIMKKWSAWHLGDGYWAETIIDQYEQLKKLS